jgi:ribosome-associated protein
MTQEQQKMGGTTEDQLAKDEIRDASEKDMFGDGAVDPDVLALLGEENDLEEDDAEEEEEDEFAGAGLTAEAKLHLIAATADAVKAEEILALDVHELTIITDYFLICTGKSSIQIRAISDRIEDKLRDAGERKLRVEGRREATWVLMDYGDVVVHVMAAEQRAFYRLEELWSDAPQVELDLLPA